MPVFCPTRQALADVRRIELRSLSGVTCADMEDAMKEPKDTSTKHTSTKDKSKQDPVERDPLPQERASKQQKEDAKKQQ